MTATLSLDPSTQRLRRIERVGFASFLVCASVFLMECAVEAVGIPRSFMASVADLPGQLLAALVIGTVSSIVPASPLGENRRIRITALIALLGSVGLLAFTIGILAMMALVMDNFD